MQLKTASHSEKLEKSFVDCWMINQILNSYDYICYIWQCTYLIMPPKSGALSSICYIIFPIVPLIYSGHERVSACIQRLKQLVLF